MITTKTITQEANIYVFDLDNCAREFGFKPEEGWELRIATSEERKDIEKRYYPTISLKTLPEILPPLFNLVKARLTQLKSGIINSLDGTSAGGTDLQYLVAYNPKRLR